MTDPTDSLAAALDRFDRTEANLKKLQTVWDKIFQVLPSDLVFGMDTDELDDLRRSFDDLVEALPPIDGFVIEARPYSADAAAQARFDALEISLEAPHARLEVERSIELPGREINEYRYRLHSARRTLVRREVEDVLAAIDGLLRDVDAADGVGAWRAQPRWEELTELIERLDRLVGDMVPGKARWKELRRHLRFAQANDLSDIKTMDWPSVRAEVTANLYSDREPIPVGADDLGTIAMSRPSGPVSTRLNWESVTAEDSSG